MVVFSLRDLFIWANFFCVSFFSCLMYLPTRPVLYSEVDKAWNGPFLQYFPCYVVLVSACIDTDIQP